MGYSPWGRTELDMADCLNNSHRRRMLSCFTYIIPLNPLARHSSQIGKAQPKEVRYPAWDQQPAKAEQEF